MKIGVLGTGNVGKVLASAFITLGPEVMMGSRSADNAAAMEWKAGAGAKASNGTFADAAQFGDIIVLATRGTSTGNVIDGAGAARFAGKVVIDTTNPLDFSTGRPRLAVGHTDSAGEQVQRKLPTARVVKAFNIVGTAQMFRPDFPGGPPDMFIAGNDADAKAKVTAILKEFGWDTIDLGGIESSRYLEPMCLVWVTYAAMVGSANHAFKLLRK